MSFRPVVPNGATVVCVRTRKLAVFAGTSVGPAVAVSSTLVPPRMSSVTLTVTMRDAGLVAYTWVITVIGPLATACSFVQLILIVTACCWLAVLVSQVFVKFTLAGVGLLVTSHVWS